MKKWAFFWVLAWCGGNAGAAEEVFWSEDVFWSGGVKLAGEIVVVPSGGAAKSSAAGASESRKKARSSRNDPSAPAATAIVIVPEEEEGVLSPSGMGAPPDNRAKARDYSRDSDSGSPATVLKLPDNAPDGTETARDSLEKNRSKARRYSEGDTGNGGKAGTYVKIGTSVGVVGSDGVVVFVCDDTNNTAGHIGDDTRSGNVFSIVINGNLVKARCK
ncbi:MAG: hypothetical protein Q8O38_11360 [Sulfurimicrobium sp.]|nr:hypothetical protein [Sulfurimicrobium sp.]